MSAKKVLTVLKKYALVIAAFAIIAGAAGAAYTYLFMTPVYEARAQILVNQEPEEDAAPAPDWKQTSRILTRTMSLLRVRQFLNRSSRKQA
ncbi:Wzz/FepE/Etk N-terminal domain-containing protein [Marinococcus halophilus]|uniref:Wzz/FepE/Etk N-terminal domain-containing protein n=1 Tax=Marinococcus halophilus TaxID=1371 RepID=UPI00360CCB88